MLKAFVKVYQQWYSWVVSLLVSVLFMYILKVSLVWEFYVGVIFTPNLGLSDKLSTIFDPLTTLFSFMEGQELQSVLIVLVSLLQGIVLNLILYIKVFKKSELQANASCKIGAGTATTGGIGAVISFLGVGCVPCKTALISPILSVLLAGSVSVFAQTVVMIAILLISVLLSVYSILKMLESIKEVENVGSSV
jgi:hypothetical protein